MDHNIASLTRSIKAHNYLINLTLLLVSIYLFSFFFFPSFLLALLHHFKFCFSTFLFPLFTHTIDKNCMFLLCNGLLVFVGITRSLSGCSGVDEPSKYIEDGSHSQYSDVEANYKPMLEKEVKEKTSEPDEHTNEADQAIEIKYSDEEVEENIENIILEDGEEGKGSKSNQSALKEDELSEEEIGLFDADVKEEDKGSEIDEFMTEENIEEEMIVEEENWVLSTEELNKKFDDFIRRMKDDLRIEAQQRSVMV